MKAVLGWHGTSRNEAVDRHETEDGSNSTGKGEGLFDFFLFDV